MVEILGESDNKVTLLFSSRNIGISRFSFNISREFIQNKVDSVTGPNSLSLLVTI